MGDSIRGRQMNALSRYSRRLLPITNWCLKIAPVPTCPLGWYRQTRLYPLNGVVPELSALE